jgi:AraC family transcriptional regulator of adaptative response/methylated-DNA-[protein]-cysteine methyltransferase
MYRALVDRDASYDGLFFVAVKSTGIFCRPVCPARKPKAENVEYFATSGDAIRAGYRACRRCRPLDANGATPDWVTRLRDAVDRSPGGRLTDDDLRGMSIDPARARRWFKRRYGMTFHAYHRAWRVGRALGDVRRGRALPGAGVPHGFESESGFREACTRLFGAPPGRSRSTTILLARWLDTPLGAMLAIASDDGLALLEFVDRRGLERQVTTLRTRLDAVVVPGDNDHLAATSDALAGYFAGDPAELDLALHLVGTPFQLAVWAALRRIPRGGTISYATLAERVGRPGASRAVGRANGDNRIAIVVPCHRVVRSDGTLCGYAGGLRRKQWLLHHEETTATFPRRRV